MVLTDVTRSLEQIDNRRHKHDPYYNVLPAMDTIVLVAPQAIITPTHSSAAFTHGDADASSAAFTHGDADASSAAWDSSPTLGNPQRVLTKRYVDGRPVVMHYESLSHAATAAPPPTAAVVLIERRRHHYRGGEPPRPPLRFAVPSSMEDLPLLSHYVVVESDRSQDIGRVVGTERVLLSDAHSLARVVRVATEAEQLDFMDVLPADDDGALQAARRLSRAVPPLDVVDATFQADRKKLTVWYSADTHVNYRPLTRALHRKFRCRVWLEDVRRSASRAGVRTRGETQ